MTSGVDIAPKLVSLHDLSRLDASDASGTATTKTQAKRRPDTDTLVGFLDAEGQVLSGAEVVHVAGC